MFNGELSRHLGHLTLGSLSASKTTAGPQWAVPRLMGCAQGRLSRGAAAGAATAPARLQGATGAVPSDFDDALSASALLVTEGSPRERERMANILQLATSLSLMATEYERAEADLCAAVVDARDRICTATHLTVWRLQRSGTGEACLHCIASSAAGVAGCSLSLGEQVASPACAAVVASVELDAPPRHADMDDPRCASELEARYGAGVTAAMYVPINAPSVSEDGACTQLGLLEIVARVVPTGEPVGAPLVVASPSAAALSSASSMPLALRAPPGGPVEAEAAGGHGERHAVRHWSGGSSISCQSADAHGGMRTRFTMRAPSAGGEGGGSLCSLRSSSVDIRRGVEEDFEEEFFSEVSERQVGRMRARARPCPRARACARHGLSPVPTPRPPSPTPRPPSPTPRPPAPTPVCCAPCTRASA